MPQAPGSLSKSQILALESVWLFLRTLPAFLLAVADDVDLPSQELINEQINLANQNRERLVDSFPAVSKAAKRWGGQ